jgi:ubiquinone/menaquinone biosynthesis C-methylase UbiE
VGSGRFAAPLGVQVGLDPSPALLVHADACGIEVAKGTAENLPFAAGGFDHALVVTIICLVDSPSEMHAEAHRVPKPGGRLLIGFIDRESALGRDQPAHQAESVFYHEAAFYSADEVARRRLVTGFSNDAWSQSLARPLSEMREVESLRAGWGQGAFVVIAATSQG